MLTITLVVSLICGVILCFFGYRLFRIAMTLAGFILGAGIGYFIYNLAGSYLPSPDNGLWVLVFMGVSGILLGILSYSILKAALFYTSMFLTAFIILKTFLLTLGSGIGVVAFFMVLIEKTKIGGIADSITSIPVSNNGTVGTAVADALSKLPGSTPTENFWIIVGIALLAGVIVGGIVCLLQKPAIIVFTASFGGILISQAAVSLLQDLALSDNRAQTIVNSFAGGNGQPTLSVLIAVAFIIVGTIVQFKIAKNK